MTKKPRYHPNNARPNERLSVSKPLRPDARTKSFAHYGDIVYRLKRFSKRMPKTGKR